jgi:hypothetical protein
MPETLAKTVVQLALLNTTESPLDRGECQELNTDTMKRCTGRMEASYKITVELLMGFPSWCCSLCGRKYTP